MYFAGLRVRSLLDGVGFLRTLEVGVDFLYDSDTASPTE